MTTTAQTLTPTTRSPLRATLALTRCELLKLSRNPMFMLGTVLFPTVFFAMFALPSVKESIGQVGVGQYFVISYSAYSLLSVALFSFGVSVAAERGMGWTRLLRVAPMPPAAYFAAKITAGLLIGLLAILILVAFASLVGGVRFDFPVLGLAIFKLLVGMVPLVLLGLFIGYAANPTSAAVVAQFLFIPLSFMSGLFIPLSQAPHFMQQLAPFSPVYHFAQIGWTTIGAPANGSELSHWLWLLGYGALFLILALWAYRRAEDKSYS